MDDFQVDFVRFNFAERVHNGFCGALSVSLDDHFQTLGRALLERVEEVFQRDRLAALCRLLFGIFFSLLRQLARLLLVFDDVELDACLRNAIEPEHFDGDRWFRLFETLPFSIDQCLDPSVVRSTNLVSPTLSVPLRTRMVAVGPP